MVQSVQPCKYELLYTPEVIWRETPVAAPTALSKEVTDGVEESELLENDVELEQILLGIKILSVWVRESSCTDAKYNGWLLNEYAAEKCKLYSSDVISGTLA